MLAAVSGGIDSVAMLHLLIAGGFETGIAHCNFSLRGKESEADEKFVRALAERLKVPFFSVRFNTTAYSEQKGISIQMAARELRYDWLESIRKQNGYDFIAVGHHSDDSIETFFINLIRGTGIAGLHGIKAKSGKIVRPLIDSSRKEIEDFVKSERIKFREDSSNNSDKYLRNKIRLQLIPFIEKLNPDFKNSVISAMENIAGFEMVFKAIAEKEKRKVMHTESNKVMLDIEKLSLLNHAELFLFEYLNPFGFKGDIIKNIAHSLKSEPGKIFHSPTHSLLKDRKYLIISGHERNKNSQNYLVNIRSRSISHPIKMKFTKTSVEDGFTLSKEKNFAYMDFDRLNFPLQLRKWKQGDHFYPFGMNGRKKISDFYTDIKLSRYEKESTWLLCSGDEIIWVVGHRPDNRFRVTKETKTIFIAHLLK